MLSDERIEAIKALAEQCPEIGIAQMLLDLLADRAELVEARTLLSKYAEWHRESHEALDAVGIARMTDGQAPRPLSARAEEMCRRLGEEQRARWAAEQDCQHWREKAEEVEREREAIALELSRSGDAIATLERRVTEAQDAREGAYGMAEHERQARLAAQQGRDELAKRLAETEACLDNASKYHVARALGLQAREHGEVREAVPYPEHTSEWRGWLIGWVKADQDAQLAEAEAGAAAIRRVLEDAPWPDPFDSSRYEGWYTNRRDRILTLNDAGRAHLEADAKREALGRATAAILQRYRAVPLGGGVLLKEDADQVLEQAHAAGWLKEEDNS